MFWFPVLSTYLSACFNVRRSTIFMLIKAQAHILCSGLQCFLLVRLFQCSSQHNLCAHQRARTPRGFYSLPRLFSKLDSCRAFNSFISLSLKLIVLGLSSDSGPLLQSKRLIRFSAETCKICKTGRSRSKHCPPFSRGILE